MLEHRLIKRFLRVNFEQRFPLRKLLTKKENGAHRVLVTCVENRLRIIILFVDIERINYRIEFIRNERNQIVKRRILNFSNKSTINNAYLKDIWRKGRIIRKGKDDKGRETE